MRAADEVDNLLFTDVKRRLGAYLRALWRLQAYLRALPDGAPDRPRRATFDGLVVRLPSSFRGHAAAGAANLYRACAAHIAAHLLFSGNKFPVGSLKPLQVALVSLIEDARVEHLAMRAYPGLRRLWLPFHTAAASGPVTAPGLMARLARALIDPGYDDANGWVQKGRQMFFAAAEQWADPAISRTIGGLLGNDIGQMRVQFNAKAYVVEPAYRDDNHGLWDYGDAGAGADADAIVEPVRTEREENQDADKSSPEDEPEPTGPEVRVAPAPVDADVGIPMARYAEWDFVIGRERADWTTIVQYDPREGRPEIVESILDRHREVVRRISALIRSAKVGRPLRLRRQHDGDRLDIDACIDAAIDARLGLTPDPRVYARLERRFRDLSVLLLLDVSQSTADPAPGTGRTVLDLEREASVLLAQAMAGLGDPFAIHAFCSDTRADVRYYRLKDFSAPYGLVAARRLAGLKGRLSTRMGAALRHASRELTRQTTYRRLLLMISDGEPSDVDVADRRYLVEDARRAVMSANHLGVDVFCVGLDPSGDAYLTRIFGRHNVVQIDRIERLPEKLPLLYFRLTS